MKRHYLSFTKALLTITFFAALAQTLSAKIVSYDLTISEKTIQPAGKAVPALVLNGGIPGPTLRFKVGDTARITVHNKLAKEQTSIHWHGILLPNKEDGVPYLTTPPIESGTSRVFEFKLTHSGTYWYHSHSGLQEQRGVYGSIVVEPKKEMYPVDREYVVVLSDWTNENPSAVLKNLVRGSEYYSIKKGNAQSLYGAYKAGALKAYMARQQKRMQEMDISDVAYDQFWANGKPKIHLNAKPGERVKLRIINAAASTYFYVNSATGKMKLVAADGPDVQPVDISRLLIGIAETYDAVITVPKHGSYEVRATAQDGSGHASIILGKGTLHATKSPPQPKLYMAPMQHGNMPAMKHDMHSMKHDMPTMAMGNAKRPQAPYQMLKSPTKTSFKASLPRKNVTLRLTGDMKRYRWSFNGKTLREDSTIHIKKGEIVRFTFINKTMMHHPLHLHGHFFRVLNKHGDYSPLKHTVDIPPLKTQVIEFEANEEKDWFFHCHILYHVETGMARVVSYNGQGKNHKPSLDPKLLHLRFLIGEFSLQSHISDGAILLRQDREDFYFSWVAQFEDDREYEADFGWSHYVDKMLSSVAGYRLTNEDGSKDRFFAGVDYLLPYLVDSTYTVDSEGDFRINLTKEFELTSRLTFAPEIQYDTGSEWEWGLSADYLLNETFSLTSGYDSEYGFGGGIRWRF